MHRRHSMYLFSLVVWTSLGVGASPAMAGIYEGFRAYQEGNYSLALKEFRPQAERGEATAQAYVGLLYFRGLEVPQNYKEARHWFLRAAKQGNVSSQFNLGLMYQHGLGVPRDQFFLRAARRWYISPRLN